MTILHIYLHRSIFLSKNVYRWAKLFKGWYSIQDEKRPDRPTIVSTPEMVYSVNEFILADRRVATENISEQWGISEGTAHKIVYDDLAFSKVSCWWFSPGLCKASYCNKNRGNPQSVWLWTATTSSLGSRSDPLWFSLVRPPLKNFSMEQSFQMMMKWRAAMSKCLKTQSKYFYSEGI